MTTTQSIARPQARAPGQAAIVELTETQFDQAAGGLVSNERKAGDDAKKT